MDQSASKKKNNKTSQKKTQKKTKKQDIPIKGVNDLLTLDALNQYNVKSFNCNLRNLAA